MEQLLLKKEERLCMPSRFLFIGQNKNLDGSQVRQYAAFIANNKVCPLYDFHSNEFWSPDYWKIYQEQHACIRKKSIWRQIHNMPTYSLCRLIRHTWFEQHEWTIYTISEITEPEFESFEGKLLYFVFSSCKNAIALHSDTKLKK